MHGWGVGVCDKQINGRVQTGEFIVSTLPLTLPCICLEGISHSPTSSGLSVCLPIDIYLEWKEREGRKERERERNESTQNRIKYLDLAKCFVLVWEMKAALW